MKNISDLDQLVNSIVEGDPYLKPYENLIKRRIIKIQEKENELKKGYRDLSEFAQGHKYFGLHKLEDKFIFREWAPNAEKIYIIGDFSGWNEEKAFSLKKINENGVWEILLPNNLFHHENQYKLRIYWPGGSGDRIPSYATRVVQDHKTNIFNAQVWKPPVLYQWQNKQNSNFTSNRSGLFIYEAHVGMAQEEGRVGTYKEFTKNIIPRIAKTGYTAIQLMAIPEHPYYGSFGYHISSFFAPSSRFGTPEDLKKLIDTAHSHNLLVIMDIIHSHAVKNEVEGLSRFDGTLFQYFHDGSRGNHIAWDSRCFNYNKNQVLHFLLSNCRYWLEEFHFDGFRFDGITSMLYHDHGLEKAFTSYDDYFNSNIDEDALTYVALANKIIHEINPNAITIAEDISGMPGLAIPVLKGGFGFDCKYAMGIPDLWIRILTEFSDENWPLKKLWYELNNRRYDEKTISYTESHDQALVGDKSLIFRMIDSDIYNYMRITDENIRVDRGMALHKLIRLLTMATAGHGYQNFMGNEFGHPEWIDFPRKGNNWSYHYARRQWHLADDQNLKYHYLGQFDRDMIDLAKTYSIYSSGPAHLLNEHNDDKILSFLRGSLIFIFNFNPVHSYTDYHIHAPAGKYIMVLDSDSKKYGGHGRLTPDQTHHSNNYLSLYLPTRTVIVLKSM